MNIKLKKAIQKALRDDELILLNDANIVYGIDDSEKVLFTDKARICYDDNKESDVKIKEVSFYKKIEKEI